MIKEIRILDTGPYVGFHLLEFEKGKNVLQGPNESGKTTFLDAVCWCLTGRDSLGEKWKPERINDGAELLRIEIVTFKGSLIGRSLSKEGAERKYVKGKDELEPRTCSTDLEFRTFTKMPDADFALSILAPRYALSVLGKGNASDLRDLLDKTLPSGPGDLETEVKAILEKHGFQMHGKDGALPRHFTLHLEAAETTRRDTKRTLSQQKAKLAVCQQQLAALKQELAAMPAVIDDIPETPEEAMEREEKLYLLRQKSEANQKELEAKLTETFATDLDSDVKGAAYAVQFAKEALTVLQRDRKCSCCERPLDEAATTRFQKRLVESNSWLERAKERRQTEEGKWKRERELDVKKLKAEQTRIRNQIEQLQASARTPKTVLAAQADEKMRRHMELEADIAGLTATIEEDNWTLAFLDSLVQALRLAPARLAQARISQLGTLGENARIEFAEDPGRGEPFVRLLYKGMDAHLASDGAAIAIDLAFRVALRRAAKLEWMPLFVDRMESVGSERIQAPAGQCFFLSHNEHIPTIQIVKPSAAAQGTPEFDCNALYAQIQFYLESEEKAYGGQTEVTREIRSQADTAFKNNNIQVLKDRLRFLKGE